MRRAFLAVIVLAACNNGSAKPQPSPSAPRDATTADADPSKLEGEALYQTLCAQCHGRDLKGYKADNAPSLNNPSFLASATDDYLRRSITMGRPGTSMAAYGAEVGGPLDPKALERLVTFIRSKGVEAQPVAPVVTAGDSTRGGVIYARDCQKCHGDRATRATAVHLANVQFLAVADDAFIRHAIAAGRPGTPMEAFATKLGAQDLDDVVAFVRTFAGPVPAPEPGDEALLAPPTGKEPLVINPAGKEPAWPKLRSDPGQTVGRYVSIDAVKQQLAAGRKMIIIDARPPSDWRRAHIKGAVSIPYHDMARLAEVPKDVWAIAYCACPHHLSGIVVDELIKRGYKKALVLDEGVLEWHRRGYPMTTAPGVQPPPKEMPRPNP